MDLWRFTQDKTAYLWRLTRDEAVHQWRFIKREVINERVVLWEWLINTAVLLIGVLIVVGATSLSLSIQDKPNRVPHDGLIEIIYQRAREMWEQRYRGE